MQEILKTDGTARGVWISNRKDLKLISFKYTRVCSDHFVKPSATKDEKNPDKFLVKNCAIREGIH